jgi:hypothetical protein
VNWKKEENNNTARFSFVSHKNILNLYTLLCFAISPDPKKLIDDFDERMGIAI